MIMKQNLGKIIILLLITINIFASGVEVILDRPAIYKGDKVSFTIKASGSDVEFPNIKNIDGYSIDGVSKSSSTSIINGDISKSISQRYTFSPLESVVIPSFTIEIDGKEYKTKAKKVSVLKATQSKKGDDFIVELSTDKNKLYVGESTILNIAFKQKLNAKADKLNLNKPELSDFWMKKIKDSDQYNDGEYIVQTFKYLIFPQKDGNLTINSIQADIGKIVRDRNSAMFNDPFFNSFSNQIRWAKIYSNSLNI
ncbi:MAG: BatD family protein, partial [Campylobacterota bacterium]|nr:BatD family protein [Campylobacterota bacterium]